MNFMFLHGLFTERPIPGPSVVLTPRTRHCVLRGRSSSHLQPGVWLDQVFGWTRCLVGPGVWLDRVLGMVVLKRHTPTLVLVPPLPAATT
jgi:hypothetical protein